ncbi:MAG: hypothetical protein JWR80_3170 [Bradyrhizobium sp.]|nr:hypothetical protein [Bradyrhizobium sp.]
MRRFAALCAACLVVIAVVGVWRINRTAPSTATTSEGGIAERSHWPWLKRVAVALAILPATPVSAGAGPPPPTTIGMNVPGVKYYAGTAAFANLVIGSVWQTPQWTTLPEQFTNGDGDILSLPAGGAALRMLSMPGTGAEGDEILCTFSGSGSLGAGGSVTRISTSTGNLRFRIVNTHTAKVAAWLVLTAVNPSKPLRDLDCRSTKLARNVRFRPQFVDSMRGYRVLRFMDWQNTNDNTAISWSARHRPTSNRFDADGISVEDMLALAKDVDADPWFVMPWNADDEFIAGFARLVRDTLPSNHRVYVEVGNEIWNTGFAASRQATQEGLSGGLSTNSRQANLRRYAQRIIHVMEIWARVFGDRERLVRVAATQHVIPDSAQEVLRFPGLAAHIDALATAPYFGGLIGGNSVGDANTMFAYLKKELDATLSQARENRAVAAQFNKRYIAYEGGQGLILPGVPDLYAHIQRDERMYLLYKDFLIGWKRDIGDVICLLTSAAPITTTGAWGLAEYEGQSPAQAPKLRAVLEERRQP